MTNINKITVFCQWLVLQAHNTVNAIEILPTIAIISSYKYILHSLKRKAEKMLLLPVVHFHLCTGAVCAHVCVYVHMTDIHSFNLNHTLNVFLERRNYETYL